ncbi:MAG TPA: SDR family oxidoreductase, partial [Longimicrobium sp.]
AADGPRPLRDWFYTPLWHQTPGVDASAEIFRGRRTVVFGGADAAPLADRLRAAGADVVRVEPGDGFRDAGAYLTVRATHHGDYASLARVLADRGWAGETHTLHLWSLDDPASGVGLAAAEHGLARGMGALLHWIQAASSAGLLAGGSTLLGATRGAQAVLGHEALLPWQAPLVGLLKTAEQEHAGVRARAVDVEAHGWEDAVLHEAAHLLEGTVADEPEVAYRGRGRWAPFHAHVPAEARPEPRVRLREGGVYLVTGGLGATGLAVARHLAAQARARLVLTVRQALPPREAWDALVGERGEADATRRAILAVRELESLGAEVRLVPAELADADSVRAVVDAAVAEWGALHGVVHAAGAASGGPIATETPEKLAAALAPAVAGTLALDAATADVPLDFFVLCSSLHAVYGGAGALEHAAAGAFLDAFASWRSWRAGRPAVAVGWAPEGMTPQEGGQAFGRVLEHGFGPRVAVCTRDLQAVAEQLRRGGSAVPAAAPAARHPRPEGAGAYVEPRSELEAALAGMYAAALGIGRIGGEDDFFEMGGDSLLATQLLSAINEKYRVDLPLRTLFEAPTPARLAVAIVQRQAEQVDDDLWAQVLAEL